MSSYHSVPFPLGRALQIVSAAQDSVFPVPAVDLHDSLLSGLFSLDRMPVHEQVIGLVTVVGVIRFSHGIGKGEFMLFSTRFCFRHAKKNTNGAVIERFAVLSQPPQSVKEVFLLDSTKKTTGYSLSCELVGT